MASIAKAGTPSPCSFNPASPDFFGENIAGEPIAAGDQLYLKNDGMIYRAIGTANNAAAIVIGQAPAAAAQGEAVTVSVGQRFWYGSGLTPGSQVYLDTVAGGLNTAPTTGGLSPLGYVLADGARIQFYRPRGTS